MDNVNIAKLLKKIKSEQNITQRQIAERMKVSQAYISQLENEKRYPTAHFVKFFCMEFNIDN